MVEISWSRAEKSIGSRPEIKLQSTRRKRSWQTEMSLGEEPVRQNFKVREKRCDKGRSGQDGR